jgi:SAM-dependent methyltransferase
MSDPRDDTARMAALREHEAQNRASWDAYSDEYQSLHGPQLATHDGYAWGMFQIPEEELQVLGDVAGKDVLEFGCGAAQWSIALAKRDARVTGIDLSERQLEHARENVAAAGVDVRLVHASAESVPLPDASFDIVFCDHGAMTFADPYRTVPEAARLVRPGGLFAFSHGSAIADLVWPEGEEHMGDHLVVDYFGLRRLEDDGDVTFQLPYAAPGRGRELVPRSGGRRVGAPLARRIDLAPPEGVTVRWPSGVSISSGSSRRSRTGP